MSEKKIKNKNALIIGLLSGLLVVLFICELFQAGIAIIAGASNLNFTFTISGLAISFGLPAKLNIIIPIVVYLSPLLLLLILLELGIKYLKHSELGFRRYSTIIFEMILVGFLIVNLFYGAISVILQMPDNDWKDLVSYLNLSFEGGIIFIFFIIIISAAYLNFATKRIINYINA